MSSRHIAIVAAWMPHWFGATSRYPKTRANWQMPASLLAFFSPSVRAASGCLVDFFGQFW
jgi:hypothetical protein